MRIGIDARFITRQPRRGIGNYSLNLVAELVRLDPSVEYFLYISQPDIEGILPKLPNVTIRRLWMPFYPLWENIALPLAAWKDRIEILHSLGNTAPLVMPPGVRLVLSLMDVMFLQSGEFIPVPTNSYQKFGRIYRSFVVPRCVRLAKAVITISDYSKQDIFHLISGIDSSLITVTHLSCDAVFSNTRKSVSEKHAGGVLSTPFIFCLGADDPRKNTLRLVRSYIQLLNEFGIKEDLVISGYRNWESSESYQAVIDAGVEDRVQFLNFIDIDELAQLYKTANIFVYPSLYEGFGIPILEAFSSGCPVVASNVTSIPEVGGDAALYFDPLSEKQIAEAVFQILNDINLRSSLIERGYRRARQFSWTKTAQNTLEVYKRCLA